MMDINLNDFILEIENEKVLIPDFQRGFVWKDIEMQKRLVASVLAKLPIGSILLLDGDSNEFQAREIGRKEHIQVAGSGQRKYLLDGQQRITVLTNVFSNTILQKGNLSKLVSTSLKNRFFIEVNHTDDFANPDILGITNLFFPFNPSGEPNFLANQMYEKILVESSIEHKVLPSPTFDFSSVKAKEAIISYCTTEDNNSLKIPLVLLSSTNGLNIISSIIKKIALFREEDLATIITDHYCIGENLEFKRFTDSLKDKIDKLHLDEFYKNEEAAISALKELKQSWEDNMRDYLAHLITNLQLNEIIVPNSQRARAIDIYENLNKGGITLSTFDLIVAKAAQEDKNSFSEKIVKELSKPLGDNEFYPMDFKHNDWNAVDNMSAFNDKKNEFSSIFINVFLNLLAIKIRRDQENFDVDLKDVKRESILELSSPDIIENYEQVVLGIRRALLLMNLKLGISKITQVKYEHVLLNLSRVLMYDEYWSNTKTLKKLEYWYWLVMFSGSYDKDQSSQMITDMRKLDKFIKGEITFKDDYFESLYNNIFSSHYFTNKEILLMKQADLNNIPKKVIRDMIMEFVLANRPCDFMKDSQANEIILKSYDDLEKEKHHIIPLASATSVGQSSKELREEEAHYLNSPLNFTIISKEANKSILSEPLNSYMTRLPNFAIDTHFMPLIDVNRDKNTDMKWLEARYDRIKSAIKVHLQNLST